MNEPTGPESPDATISAAAKEAGPLADLGSSSEIYLAYPPLLRRVAIRKFQVPVEKHLADCVECWTKLDDFRVLAAAFEDDETWWILEELQQGRGRVLRDYVERGEAEDAEAARMLDRPLESPYQFAKANVLRKKRFQTGGVVRLLCKAVREQSMTRSIPS